MIHLCGLPLPREAIDIYWNERLSEDEAKSLDDFEEAHTQRKPNNSNEDSTPVFAGLNDAIGDDGWRELDRFTLYRFLCADKLDGEFQPDKSMDRLHRALRYRKESNTDVILNWWLAEEEKEKEEDDEDDDDDDEKTAHASSSIPKLDPGFSRADLDKYQRIRIQRFTGRDKVGQPVSFVRLGAFLGSGNSSQFTIDQWIRCYIWDLERTYVEMRKAAREANQPIEKYVFCGDWYDVLLLFSFCCCCCCCVSLFSNHLAGLFFYWNRTLNATAREWYRQS